MAISASYLEYLEDLFSGVPGASIRKMFGGVGVFRHGLMFALATSDGKVAFKADQKTIPEFVDAGSSEWVYENKSGKSTSMGYWYAPDFLLDDADEFSRWAEQAFETAARLDALKPEKQRKLKPAGL